MYTEKRQLIIWALCGFLMSIGMSLGGMAHQSSLSFFDPFDFGNYAAFYTPSMFAVFIAALTPSFMYWQLYRRPSTPLFDTKWHIPTNTVIDGWLLGGSVIFGLGWAVGGFCPGPSVAGLITGHPTFVAFSYGLYFYKVVRGIKGPSADAAHPHHWMLTIGLGFVPAFFYFYGPTWFPTSHLAPLPSYPISLSFLAGLAISTAAILFAHFNGKILGVSSIWRGILNVYHPIDTRLPHILFFLSFLAGAVVTYRIFPHAFAQPPYANESLLRIFIGGVLVGIGTDWANGCTSGHGVCGVPRLSRRSIVAVASFMASVFVFLPIVNSFIL